MNSVARGGWNSFIKYLSYSYIAVWIEYFLRKGENNIPVR